MRKKDKNKNRDKDNKKKGLFYKIIAILQIVFSFILIGFIVVIDILPFKYLSCIIGGLLILDIIIFLIMFKSRLKKGIKKFFCIVSILLSMVFAIASIYLYKTYGVISSLIDSDYEIYNYSVMVLKDSKYNTIGDLKSKSLGYYETKGKENALVLDKIKGFSTVNEKYTNLNTLGTDLLDKEIDAIVVEANHKSVLEDDSDSNEYNELKDFKSKTKVIYTFSIKVKKDDTSKDVNVVSEVFNIYISGIDTYGKVSSVSRSDVNMVVTVNPKTRQVLLTSIPRDYYVQLHDTTGYKDKLTHAGIYGTDCSIKTIEDLLGIDINYYYKVNFTSLIDIVDALGGVNVYSSESFRSWNGYNFSKGYNKVDGKAALAFVRERHAFAIGDKQRGKNQQALISAMINKCISPEILTKYTSLLNSIKGSIITNMPTKTMLSLIKMQLKNNVPWTITSNSLDGTGSYAYTYSYNYQQLYVMEPSEESVNTAKEMISKVINGSVLDSSYDDSDTTVHSVTKSKVYKSTTSSTKKKSTTTKKKNTTVKKKTVKTPVVTDEKDVVDTPSEPDTVPDVSTGNNPSDTDDIGGSDGSSTGDDSSNVPNIEDSNG